MAASASSLMSAAVKRMRALTGALGSYEYLVLVGLVCALLPFDISLSVFVFVGVLFYFCARQAQLQSKQRPHKEPKLLGEDDVPGSTSASLSGVDGEPREQLHADSDTDIAGSAIPNFKPILAPKLPSGRWEAQVNEFVGKVLPSAESERAVQEIAKTVKESLAQVFPDVQVLGFCRGELGGPRALGDAVPDVDLVIRLSPEALPARFYGKRSRVLQESLLRDCTEQLVVKGDFKFRRSALQGLEPTATIVAPASVATLGDPIPVDLSVNTHVPIFHAALLAVCGRLDSRARALIFFVMRWAENRGISHAASGHLSPFLWTLAVIYFLQVRTEGDGPLLPPLEAHDLRASFAGRAQAAQEEHEQDDSNKDECMNDSVAALFMEFASFYNASFDWVGEAVSIGLGQRRAPSADVFPRQASMFIVDPLDAKRNLGVFLGEDARGRLQQELARVGELCNRAGSISELLNS